ncbi:hypothetical protein [Halocatena marina]|uniref:Uncharacterized protein n=1 Tax=Halocatena marina TaxID=2934937 RepID=A0ABD5YXJ8_9EURY|nr:hypothetical protein [Halocatena marina]
MTNLDLHPATEAALRDLLFGVGFGCLAVASYAPQSSAFDALVVGGIALVVGGSLLGLSTRRALPLGGA